jgi:branched-chain amino acid transport system ATP-binding protein
MLISVNRRRAKSISAKIAVRIIIYLLFLYSPNLLGNVFKKLVEINKEFGLATLIVEQKVMEVLEICRRVYSIKLGRLAFEGKPEELQGNKQKIKELFL